MTISDYLNRRRSPHLHLLQRDFSASNVLQCTLFSRECEGAQSAFSHSGAPASPAPVDLNPPMNQLTSYEHSAGQIGTGTPALRKMLCPCHLYVDTRCAAAVHGAWKSAQSGCGHPLSRNLLISYSDYLVIGIWLLVYIVNLDRLARSLVLSSVQTCFQYSQGCMFCVEY